MAKKSEIVRGYLNKHFPNWKSGHTKIMGTYKKLAEKISNEANISINMSDVANQFSAAQIVKVPKKTKAFDEDGSLSPSWKNFQSRLASYNEIPFEEWNEYYFLGHILKRYKDYFGYEYTLSYTGSPSKCKEIYCVKRMISSLTTSDGNIIKNYIDYIFDEHIIKRKLNIKTLAFFFTIDLIFEFKKLCKKNSVISRTTKLPSSYQDIISKLNVDVGTYGDLAFAKLAIDNDPNNTDLQIYLRMFDGLREAGFDDSVLERLDGN